MTHYRTARALATFVVWAGWFIVGICAAIAVASVVMRTPAGALTFYPMAVGVVVALFGWLCRAVFDIADAVRSKPTVVSQEPPSRPFPLSVSDIG
ncbi:hypothetical protein [Chiayiivirga flava]|uniref:Uncharacterized protein n=1 Tax=Chiayiivirga flava TaxID=659595 RepID=A0A7W8D7W2_9GAMM|nr:hypothetical protein [Chiayiivirga flava]MBB5208395.1 hypothetical protein [Chiayiivirga flava]